MNDYEILIFTIPESRWSFIATNGVPDGSDGFILETGGMGYTPKNPDLYREFTPGLANLYRDWFDIGIMISL